jgi:DNA primase
MSQIQQVKDASNIVDVIRQRIPLQSAGKNWKGLCPFHSEKSPSFFVSEELQRYKCFGCGASGDSFTFLQQVEGLTFAEALQTLAERAGITLEKAQFSPADDQRKRWFDLLELAKSYFHFLLTEHELGAPAREYLKKRGVSSQSIKLFQIGYAPPGWDTSLKYFVEKKKYQAKELQDVGLAISGKNGRVYDRFRDRLMFPLRDHRGRVVGFSGRILQAAGEKNKVTENKEEPKYINTPETELYHKGQMLFGLFELHRSIRDAKSVIVVEGELDVISSAQVGVNHIVAVKGSVLTHDHVRLLERTVDQVVLSFDRDKAGLAATQRAIEVTRGSRLELRVLHVPPEHVGKDPDDLARHSPDVWRSITKTSQSVYEFLIEYACQQFGTEDASGKKKVIQWLAPWFGGMDSAVESEYYLQQLAKRLESSAEALRKDLQRYQHARRLTPAAPAQRPGAAGIATRPPVPTATAAQFTPTPEAYALFLTLHAEAVSEAQQQLQELESMSAGDPNIQPLVRAMAELATTHTAPAAMTASEFLQHILGALGEDQRALVTSIHLHPAYLELSQQFALGDEWLRVKAQLSKRATQRQRLDLIERVKVLESMTTRTPTQDQELETTLAALSRQPKATT